MAIGLWFMLLLDLMDHGLLLIERNFKDLSLVVVIVVHFKRRILHPDLVEGLVHVVLAADRLAFFFVQEFD